MKKHYASTFQWWTPLHLELWHTQTSYVSGVRKIRGSVSQTYIQKQLLFSVIHCLCLINQRPNVSPSERREPCWGKPIVHKPWIRPYVLGGLRGCWLSHDCCRPWSWSLIPICRLFSVKMISPKAPCNTALLEGGGDQGRECVVNSYSTGRWMKLPPIGMVDPESFSPKLLVSERGMNWKLEDESFKQHWKMVWKQRWLQKLSN